MSFQVVCPNCQRAAIATPAQSGKLRKCTGCGSMYRVVPPAGERIESRPQMARSNTNVPSVAVPSAAVGAPFLSPLAPPAIPAANVASPPAAPSNGFEYRAPLATSAAGDAQAASPSPSSVTDDFWQSNVPPPASPAPQLAWAAPTAASSASNQVATTGKKRTGSRRRKQGAATGAGLGAVALAIFFCLRLYGRISRNIDIFNRSERNTPAASQPIFIESRPGNTNNDPFFRPGQPGLPNGFGREPGRGIPGSRRW